MGENTPAAIAEPWTDWERPNGGGLPKPPKRPLGRIIVPLAVLGALVVLGATFLLLVSGPAGAAGMCGGG
ncbi:hypothetical protein [Actinomadura fibrosa]|uniref:Uncharacterized protein n=1 Tax=Actinomadura fibrosa TaxID=111802 RepID=A0ABW2XH83_9ACTN|nr:hypothetical protein [Actinomadura fibrosa]